MLFNSAVFILAFLPITFFIYFWLCRARWIVAARAWLVFTSLFFYSYWNVAYLPLILGSLLINFVIGSELSRPRLLSRVAWSRKAILLTGVVANLAVLGYFKYTDFFLANLNLVAGLDIALPGILLPLAISFFTFQQVAYLVDSYRGETAEYDFLSYALFVTFFPQLIAGPIVHHREVMPQFASRQAWVIRHRNVLRGLFIFGIGLFKKVVIADTFAPWADAGFDSGRWLDFYAAWATSLAYTFQLYFDFSGYCDMAIGAALLFNIRLPLNFNSPYKALDIQDFWRRWHMTLSRFLRDYLYIPLGGNRGSEWHTHFNLLATFILGGLWHGASWMFVIWGAMHGAALIAHRIWRRMGGSMPAPLAWVTTFLFVNVTWVFFRAKSMDDALRVLRGMANVPSAFSTQIADIPTDRLAWGGWQMDVWLRALPAGLVAQLLTYLSIVLAFAVVSRSNALEITMREITLRKSIAGALLFSIALYASIASTSSVFLYFNF